MAPDFYKPDRTFLVNFCNDLQSFIESDDDVLVINLPPRHGKSRTASLFVEWLLGNDRQKKIMTGSYNETLSTVFSKNVRNAIQAIKADEDVTVYSDIFPGVRIKPGDGAMNLWSLADGYNNYLATSPSGTATGFGADLIIIDDLIKTAEEAHNALVLEKHWNWFVDTMLSRLESGGKIVIVMTRWHSQDLAGKALEELPGVGFTLRHINLKAMQDDGTMLCDDILNRHDYDIKVKAMGADIASANYQQEPIDIKGRLYSGFKTYDKLPDNPDSISSYTDTADTGLDYLATFIYREYNKEAYIQDIIFTQDPMEVTEPLLAKKLYENNVNVSWIESNNGGRGFGRSVEERLRQKYHSNHTVFKLFTQRKNKISRILTKAPWVMEHAYFPENWKARWPELYTSLAKYQREGKNEHDDAPDALTGVAEKIDRKGGYVPWT
ncbi:terl [Agrilactobacillus composti DSM 18527 = JCM 14202]|uniref:Terl n=2 Tax=Agrilactobacillus TaxID=2767875 RepID=A0A0R1Y3R1_9LACO|nr:terl [Agrilactobacillus composti DSM 18527 = JCM 14202]